MYDIQNDTYEQTDGDFSCFLSNYIETRPLQPFSEPGKYYALTYTINYTEGTTVGIFDTETYKFSALFSSPVPVQNTDHMWIDEDEGIIYIAVDNDLPALPINIPGKEKTVSVFVDGKEVDFDVAPTLENGRTLVPLRSIAEGLGTSVDWNGLKRMVTIES